MLDFAFVAIMTNQYWACTRGDHESSIRNWYVRKEKIARKVKLKDPKFDGYCMVIVVLVFFVTG